MQQNRKIGFSADPYKMIKTSEMLSSGNKQGVAVVGVKESGKSGAGCGKSHRHREGYYVAETNTYHENIPNSKTACVRTERQQVGTK